VKRLKGTAKGKFPVTLKFLVSTIVRLKKDLSLKSTAIRAGIQVAFFLLLRSSEYCINRDTGTGDYDTHATLLDDDVVLLDANKQQVSWAEHSNDNLDSVVEVVICLKKSKTDQGRKGVVRSTQRTNEEACGVEAIVSFIKQRRAHGIHQNNQPFFRWESDWRDGCLTREHVSDHMKLTASSLNMDPSEYASHSLRIGGATAMAAAGIPHLLIKRFGRWMSDCWELYWFNRQATARPIRQCQQVDGNCRMHSRG